MAFIFTIIGTFLAHCGGLNVMHTVTAESVGLAKFESQLQQLSTVEFLLAALDTGTARVHAPCDYHKLSNHMHMSCVVRVESTCVCVSS